MIEVGILYTGNVKVWKPLTEVADFRTVDVLAFSITSERGNRQALKARQWSHKNDDRSTPDDLPWYGEDLYVIGVMPNGDFFTDQWAETDEFVYLRSSVDGSDQGRIANPRTYPAGATLHNFIGAFLEPAAWARALAVFESEMF